MASRLKLSKSRRKKSHKPFDESKTEDDDDNKQEPIRNENKINYKTEIFARAIESAKKHGIKIIPGKKNNAAGNCSYESVINNINLRSCFKEKLRMTPDFYRRIWTIDMMNKTLDKTSSWNPGLSRSQIMNGFQEMMESGVYEVEFFGDMIMPGIACGIKKRILIFHTNEGIERTGHDPVSVTDPTHYGGVLEDEIPVVVAYNLVHYESLHPIDEQDIEETIKLTKSYIAKPSRYEMDYGFTTNDIDYLVTKSNRISGVEIDLQHDESQRILADFNINNLQTSSKISENKTCRKKSLASSLNMESNEKQSAPGNLKPKQQYEVKGDKNITNSSGSKLESEKIMKTVQNSETSTKISFVFGNFVELKDGKIQCGGCQKMFSRIVGPERKHYMY